VVVRKGDSVGDFLKACRDVVRPLLTSVLHATLRLVNFTHCGLPHRCQVGNKLCHSQHRKDYIPSCSRVNVCVFASNVCSQLTLDPSRAAQLAPDFRELRNISVSNLMYVKEDLIIPNQYTFYDLIINKVLVELQSCGLAFTLLSRVAGSPGGSLQPRNPASTQQDHPACCPWH